MACLGIKKSALVLQWDKSCYSCDTTQINACAFTRLCVPSYASRLITGGLPSAYTKAHALSCRPLKAIHNAPNGCDLTARSSLNAGSAMLLLFIFGLTLCAYDTTDSKNVKPLFQKIFLRFTLLIIYLGKSRYRLCLPLPKNTAHDKLFILQSSNQNGGSRQ